MHHCRSRTIQLADCNLKSYVSVQTDTARPIMLRATNISVTTYRAIGMHCIYISMIRRN